MFSAIRKCFFPTPSEYKKVDQYRDGAITAWIENHPLPLETKLWSFSPDAIESLIENVVKSLPKNQITWDNLELIKNHLGKFADQTDCTKYSLLLEISRLNIEPAFKEELQKEISKRTPPG